MQYDVPFDPSGVPEALKRLAQWVVWRREGAGGVLMAADPFARIDLDDAKRTVVKSQVPVVQALAESLPWASASLVARRVRHRT